MSTLSPAALQALSVSIRQWARDLGFSDAGISRLELDADLEHLRNWIASGHHGSMAYMARDPEMRASPQTLRTGTSSVISVRLPYWPQAHDADDVLRNGEMAYISRYALGRDYHRVMRARLLKLARRIERDIGPLGHRVFADSAPILEKAMARNAGLGWIGKHTLLIQRRQDSVRSADGASGGGSWFFLGELFIDLPLEADAREAISDGCGRCTACIRACPTGAIVAPYQVDARRCISYLTIEHHGPIPEEFRVPMGNRIFGCDDCQLACPWNRESGATAESDFTPRHGLDAARLLELWSWDEAEWLRRTEGMPLRRLDHARWLRNLAIALGNAPRSDEVVRSLRNHANHPDAAVRDHVEWALRRQTAGSLS